LGNKKIFAFLFPLGDTLGVVIVFVFIWMDRCVWDYDFVDKIYDFKSNIKKINRLKIAFFKSQASEYFFMKNYNLKN
jgi:hypothetical protein